MNLEKLRQLSDLKDKGVLSDEEFAAAKEKLLNEADEPAVVVQTIVPQQSKFITILLCIFLGVLGIHRFYTGSYVLGLIYLLTGGIFGIGAIVGLVLLVFGKYKTGSGEYL